MYTYVVANLQNSLLVKNKIIIIIVYDLLI